MSIFVVYKVSFAPASITPAVLHEVKKRLVLNDDIVLDTKYAVDYVLELLRIPGNMAGERMTIEAQCWEDEHQPNAFLVLEQVKTTMGPQFEITI